jgi:hypothetical protein
MSDSTAPNARVSIVRDFASSDLFDRTFKEGMALVEETAAYLDGDGRRDSRLLPREDALLYAGESMRLTTRLMQIASWLLVQRAVREGDMPAQDACDEKYRIAALNAFIELQQRAAAGGRSPVADKLLFVGPELSPEMAELARASGVFEQIVVVRDVSHDELCALYASAVALLFPSLQEGFGWPVIEAQACGCPVFTSDLAPMNEIGGEGAVYVDPLDASAFATAIEQATPRLGEMRTLGLANAALYSSERMVTGYIETYRRVIEARQRA